MPLDALSIGIVVCVAFVLLSLVLRVVRALYRWRDRAVRKALESTTTLAIHTPQGVEHLHVIGRPWPVDERLIDDA